MLSLIVVACAGGCYRHVVKASGPGTNTMPVYEPNLSDDAVSTPGPAINKSVPTKTVPTKRATGSP